MFQKFNTLGKFRGFEASAKCYEEYYQLFLHDKLLQMTVTNTNIISCCSSSAYLNQPDLIVAEIALDL